MTTITQVITPLPDGPDPATDTPDSFSAKAAARVLAEEVWVTELNAWTGQANALATSLNAIASGTAISFQYTFSTTTTDSDPGAGSLRLDNATQNTATTIRLDLVDSVGTTRTDAINLFDDSTSAIRGFITLVKVGDASKWLLFSVSALASHSGYKNVTVANVASSAANPFSDGDSLAVQFTRNGDKGDTGATGTLSGAVTGNITGGDYTLSSMMLKDMAEVVVDKGNISAATVTFDYSAGSVQTYTATGSTVTWAFSNWPPTGNEGYLLIRGTNIGAYTHSISGITWLKPDGTTTTSVATYLAANTGRTAFQTSGVDQVLLWTRDAGTTIYGKLV